MKLPRASGRHAVIGVPYLWLALFFLLPFAILLRISVSEMEAVQFKELLTLQDGVLQLTLKLSNYAFLAQDDLYLRTYLASLKYAAATTLLCLAIGYPFAYFMARARSTLQPALLMLVMLPFWTSFLVRVYAWMGLLDSEGLINHALLGLGLIDQPLQLLPSGPGYRTMPNLRLFTALIHRAQHKLSITSPYFVPEESLLDAVTSAAYRGVEVELFVSEGADQFIVQHAQASYYQALLEAGVRIFLYPKPTVLHAKFFTVDDVAGVIGSSNMDYRSFGLDYEISLLGTAPEFVADLQRVADGRSIVEVAGVRVDGIAVLAAASDSARAVVVVRRDASLAHDDVVGVEDGAVVWTWRLPEPAQPRATPVAVAMVPGGAYVVFDSTRVAALAAP